jgi:hypothetical protein
LEYLCLKSNEINLNIFDINLINLMDFNPSD